MLLETLGIILTLVRLEELVGICPSWDNHGRISASSEHTLVECDVLREVGLLVDRAIWILILLLIVNYTRVGREALATSLF